MRLDDTAPVVVLTHLRCRLCACDWLHVETFAGDDYADGPPSEWLTCGECGGELVNLGPIQLPQSEG